MTLTQEAQLQSQSVGLHLRKGCDVSFAAPTQWLLVVHLAHFGSRNLTCVLRRIVPAKLRSVSAGVEKRGDKAPVASVVTARG